MKKLWENNDTDVMPSLCVLSTIRSHAVPNLSTSIKQQSVMNQKKEGTCFACWVSVGYHFICNSWYIFIAVRKEEFI